MSGEQYGDYGNPIVKALLRGWNAALGRWIPIPVDVDGHMQVDVVSLAGVSDDWHPVVLADVLDNDSDKTFVVPARTEYQPLSVLVDLTTSADVGNRQLTVLVTTAADVVIACVRAGAVQPASKTYRYVFAVGNPDLTAFRDTDLMETTLPVLVLAAGYKIRVYDKAAIQAAADDMHVEVLVMSRSV